MTDDEPHKDHVKLDPTRPKCLNVLRSELETGKHESDECHAVRGESST